MKIEEIRALSSEEIKSKINNAKQELFNLRIKLATKQLVNHREIPRVKKDIARLYTVLREREIR